MHTISSLSQYIRTVNKIQTKWANNYGRGEYIDPWFRGHSNTNFKLQPGLYRNSATSRQSLEDEEMYRLDFESKAFPFLIDTYGIPSNDWEWYFIMQHYGLPTRLLDWTRGSLIALYFSLFYKTEDDTNNSCVWLLNPFGLNEHFHAKDWIFSYQQKELKNYLWKHFTDGQANLPNNPIAFEPVYKSKRIVAQKGCFTIHGKDTMPLDEIGEIKDYLCKIEINYMHSEDIMDDIVVAGISESTLFPELSGLSRELKSYWRGDWNSSSGFKKLK